MPQTTSGAAGNGLYTTIKYLRGAVGIGQVTTPRFFCRRRKPTAKTCVDSTVKKSIGLGTTAMYMQRATSGAAGNGL